jgi:hypothetical protein
LAGEDSGAAPDVASRLIGLPNADQAYAIVSRALGSGGEILLLASTPLGLLYSARTLRQLLEPWPADPADTTLIPLGTVVDWPAVGQRGQWGGNTADALESMAELKLNSWAVHAWPGTDERGVPRIKLESATVAAAARLGIQAVPIFIHLEQLATQGMKGWEDCFNTPDPERAARSDYVPGLCLSKPRTRELIARLLELIARLPGVRGVDFCLSEEWTPCLCPDCRGKEPFLLEVEAVLAAYREVRALHPSFHLRVETSQGSHTVDDRILALLPREVGLQYYDGGRTYNSSHAPMIPPPLEAYARTGGWLGVCAQITNSWRSTLPWTAPQFVHARMSEFATKGLSYFVGYAVPANYFHEHNVAAAAEWAWNPSGRSPRELARAFATRRGIRDPELYADWAVAIGPVGWDIAGTRLYLSLIYDPTFGLDKGVPFDHRFEGGPDVLTDEQIQDDLARAMEALELARKLDLPEAVEETEIDIASLHLLRALYALSRLPAQSPDPSIAAEAAAYLDSLDRCAAVISTRLQSWGARISSRRGAPMPSRLCDTMQAVPRTANLARELIGRRLGIPDPNPAFRYKELGRWSADSFAGGPTALLSFDATACVTAAGDYAVCLDFLPGQNGLTARNVRVVERSGGRELTCFSSSDLMERISMWVTSAELTVSVPLAHPRSPPSAPARDLGGDPGASYVVEIEAEGPPAGLPADRRSCSGRVSLRRHWPRTTPGF